jgi:hypothetical protein
VVLDAHKTINLVPHWNHPICLWEVSISRWQGAQKRLLCNLQTWIARVFQSCGQAYSLYYTPVGVHCFQGPKSLVSQRMNWRQINSQGVAKPIQIAPFVSKWGRKLLGTITICVLHLGPYRKLMVARLFAGISLMKLTIRAGKGKYHTLY